MNPKKALLIIDMQNGCFTPDAPKLDADGVLERINSLSTQFRAIDAPVILIQQDSSKWKRFVPNTPEWETIPELEVSPNDISINKTANDAFYRSTLHATLKKLKVKELYITRSATEFCVNATVLSALTKDYSVTVVKDGHTTGDKPHIDAKRIVEHYNWVWQHMIPTKGSIKVLDFEALDRSTPLL